MYHCSIISRICLALVVAAITGTASAQTKSKPTEEKQAKPVHKREIGVIETSFGTIEVELYRSDAPKTVENFVRLAEKNFFDGQRFHRVSKNFVIQAGDDKTKDEKKMSEWGTGGKSIYGKEFEDELNPNTPSYKEGYVKGVLAMANRGPNTNTSQFFIMLRDNYGLPKNYTIFGKVIKGMEVVDKIGAVEIVPRMGPADGIPKEDVFLKKVTIRTEGDAK